MSTDGRSSRAVVVGASMAGLLAARVLADVVDEVVVLERERLSDAADPRGHVPQGRHLHLLLSAGLKSISHWFPGIDVELEEAGAVRVDGTGAWVYQLGGYRARGDWGASVLCMTRPLLERTVRRRVRQLARVTLRDGELADRVVLSGGRVTGVVVDGAELAADLVVDCSGRSSRIAHQLETSGELAPPVSRVSIDCAYASCLLPRRPHDFEGSFAVCGPTPPTSFRSGAVLPVEGDRWMVTLAGVHGEVPGTDPEGFRDFAHSLLTPMIGQLVDRAGPPTTIAAYRFPFSQRRHYEKVRRLPPGLVTLGDAACSFDPIYGQGMACAALQAGALGDVLRRHAPASAQLPKDFHRRAASIVDAPWSIAVGADFLHPRTEGPKPLAVDQVNRYVLRVLRATHSSVPLARTFNLVLNLELPTSALMRPTTVARVLRATWLRRRSDVPLVHPEVGAAP